MKSHLLNFFIAVYPRALFWDTLLNCLKRVQNIAARVITRTKPFEKITPLFLKLHWLPVKQRIIFKILLFMYRCNRGIAPTYLVELFKLYQPSRPLRSSNRFIYTQSVVKRSWGTRSFSSFGPQLWNKLPEEIKESTSITQFKSVLKTHLNPWNPLLNYEFLPHYFPSIVFVSIVILCTCAMSTFFGWICAHYKMSPLLLLLLLID